MGTYCDAMILTLDGPDGARVVARNVLKGELEVEYRVYDADGELYASCWGEGAEDEARRYMEQPGDYMTRVYSIEERI